MGYAVLCCYIKGFGGSLYGAIFECLVVEELHCAHAFIGLLLTCHEQLSALGHKSCLKRIHELSSYLDL